MALNLVSYLFFNSSVLEPIRKISKFVENVHEKRDQRLDLQEYDTREFKKLSQTLNQMMDFLNARDDLSMNQQKQMIYASKMSALGEMSSGIAHEINNALSVIMGYTYVLKDKIQKSKITQEEVVNQLTKIQEITEQIAKIIKGMNSFARNSS